jgi:peptidoglycan/LPS O-acetylase OafA/YrhL
MGFGLLPQADINGRNDTHAILVVLWTLKYEWIFYLAMPLLAVFARSKLAWLLYAVALLVAFPLGDSPLYGYFVAGAIAAHLIARPKLSIPVFVRVLVSLAALVGLVAGYHDIYGIEQIVLLFLIFQGVVTGAGPWGLLRAKSLRFLGVISYSTYLLHHMIVHVMVFHGFGPERFAAFDWLQFSGASVIAGTISIVLAILAYVFVEQPWIAEPSVPPNKAIAPAS